MSFDNMKNPTGGVKLERVMKRPGPEVDLLESILDPANVLKAWKRVRANKGAAGIDGMTIAEFPAFAREQWSSVRTAIEEVRYSPRPVKRVEIPKPDGGSRPLGIPTVVDRVIQQALAQILVPICDPTFSESSFGFRPGRSAHDAVYRVRDIIKEGYKIAVDVDLSSFFDTVNHDILMHRLSRHVGDKRVLKLIGSYLRAGVVVKGRLQATLKGVPQGGPLSPLLANILLDDLDKELEKRGHRFARYADDFVILVKSRRAGERVMASIRRFLERRLRLTVNEKKSRVVSVQECTFLGFTFIRGKIRWMEKAFSTFKHRVRQLTGRSWFVSMQHRMGKLAQYIRGWINHVPRPQDVV